MTYTRIKKLSSMEQLNGKYPLTHAHLQQITRDRADVKAILENQDSRLLMIIGPCSAWPEAAVLEYAQRLSILNKKIGHVLKCVMRVYIQKPRTTTGWMGPVNQPDPFAKADIEAGLAYSRAMMIAVIHLGLAIADEALFTDNASGFLNLLSWVAIGARSSEDPQHRVFASTLDCAVGLKNPTHGSLVIGVNSVIAAQSAQVTMLDGYEIQSHGNSHAHLVLRGSNQAANYSLAHLNEVHQLMTQHGIQNPALLIDVSHDNCLLEGKKHPHLQPDIVFAILDSLKNQPELKPLIKGFMVESFLTAGSQLIDVNHPDALDLNGLSITDPCLSWQQTETFLLTLATRLTSGAT